ncbi:MAG: SDR family oxidoreductase [Planctomycetota bacterium]
MPEKILITGATGFLGDHLARALAGRGRQILAAVRSPFPHARPWTVVHLDLRDPASLAAATAEHPSLIVHAAAVATLAQCERDPAAALQVNALAAETLAARAHALGSAFVLISTDQVFDGERGQYRESDRPGPVNAYGRTKLEGEERVQRAHRRALIVRLPLMFGPSATGDRGASDALHALVQRGAAPALFTDEFRSPVDVRDAARGIAVLVAQRRTGLLHLGGPERLSRFALGLLVARHFGFAAEIIRAARSADHAGPRRPRDVSLDSARARALLGWLPRSPVAALTPR